MFFDSIKNFFGKVGNFFGQVKDKVVEVVGGVYNKGKEIVSGVVDAGKGVVTTIHDDVKAYVGGVKDIADKPLDKTAGVITHAEDTIGDVGKSFSWPLTIGAAIVGGIYLMKK